MEQAVYLHIYKPTSSLFTKTQLGSEAHIVAVLAAMVVLGHQDHFNVINKRLYVTGFKKVRENGPHALDTCAAWLKESEAASEFEPGLDLAFFAELFLRLPKGRNRLHDGKN